jgi:flagellar biosynthesis protein FlhF
MRAAMEQVRTALGTEAVIMSSKKVTGGVEIVAAKDYDPSYHSEPQEATQASQASQLSQAQVSSFDASVEQESILSKPPKDALEFAHKQSLQEQSTDSKPKITEADVDSLKALLERQSKRIAEQERVQQEQNMNEQLDATPPTPSLGAKQSAKLPEWAKVMSKSYQGQQGKQSKRPEKVKPSDQGTEELSRDLVQIKADMKSLRDLLTHQVSSLIGDHREREDPLSCMLEKHLVEAQFSEVVAQRLTEMVSDYEPENMLSYLPTALANMLSVQRDDIVRQGGVVALVGPTGVGKTTTLAKLAARYASQQGPDKLGLITTDHYRIGAYEQLATYGRIIGCAVKKAANMVELEQALYQLRTRHFVLIDTAGMSQKNMQLSQQLDNLVVNPNLPIRSYLVMSTVGQREVLSDIVSKFRRIPLSGCILTKTDESLAIGGALSVIIENELPLSYVTYGQRVPEDLIMADPKKLAEQALALIMEQQPKQTPSRAHWADSLMEIAD